MLVFQIKDDKEHIFEKKNLKRKSKKMILGLDDQGLQCVYMPYCHALSQDKLYMNLKDTVETNPGLIVFGET